MTSSITLPVKEFRLVLRNWRNELEKTKRLYPDGRIFVDENRIVGITSVLDALQHADPDDTVQIVVPVVGVASTSSNPLTDLLY